MGYRTPTDEPAVMTTLTGNAWPEWREEYAAKLTTPEEAVSTIQSGSTLCPALGVGMPGGLAKAVSERVLSGDLKDLNLYYRHAMKYNEETLIRPKVLTMVNACCFFMGDPDRKMVNIGLGVGRQYLSDVPINFSNIPRVLTVHVCPSRLLVTMSPMDKSGHFSLGTNNDYASTLVRSCRA